MKILEVQHLSKTFGSLEVLKDISFSIEKGKVVSIIGPSGSGKSTLLRCINNLELVSGGSISVLGSHIVQNGIYARPEEVHAACLKIGLVFQNFNLFPHFSVLRNITEAQVKVLGRSLAQSNKKAIDLLEKMGLEEKIHSYPYQLSGGQQQRVSIARALALDPEILFFDEPTSALDPELTGEILKVIRSLACEKMTMCIVTHEMAFARDVSDYVIFMDGGLIVEEGPAISLINNPQNERTRAFLHRFTAED